MIETDKVEESEELTDSTVGNILNLPMSLPPGLMVEKIETNKNALKDQI